MNEFLRYALLANVSLLLVWVAYRLWLRNITHHIWNRAFLLIGSMLAVVLPLIPIGMEEVTEVVAVRMPEIVLHGNNELAYGKFQIVAAIPYLYMSGVGVMAFFQLVMLFRLGQVVSAAHRAYLSGVEVRRSDAAGPFSFFYIIHVPLRCDADELRMVLRHELVHVRQWHSADVLWLLLLRTVFWFNPLLVFLQRDLQMLHEFLADEDVIAHSDPDSYTRLQMAHAFGLEASAFPVNRFFNQSTLKNRIAMMYRKKSTRISLMRYTAIAPVVAAMMFASACTQEPADQVQEAVNEVFKQAEKMPEYPGGFHALASELGASIEYPITAKQDSAEGTVFVQFVVDENGRLTDAEVVKSVHSDLDAEALRVVKSLKGWSPGQNGDKPVRVQMVLPIRFVLG